MSRPLRVLVVEDNKVDAELIIRELRDAGFEPQWERVDTEAGFRVAIESSPDLILSDYTMPQFDGLAALSILRASGKDIPFILVSGTVGEEIAVESMRRGASDYLLKDRLGRLGSAVERAIEETRLRRERELVEGRLNASKMRYRRLFEATRHGILMLDFSTGAIEDINPFLVDLFGISKEECLGEYVWDQKSMSRLAPSESKYHQWKHGDSQDVDILPLDTIDGRQIIVECLRNVYDTDKSKVLQLSIRDISDRVKAEESLRQSEARLRIVTDRAQVGLVVINSDRRYTFANAAYAEIFNLSSHDLLGKTVAEILPSVYDQKIRPRLDEAFTGKRVGYELQVPISMGGKTFVITYEPVIVDEVVTSIVVVVIDITEKKATETLLRIQDRAMQAASQGIVIVDAMLADFPIIFANRGFETITGYPLSESLGKNCRILQGDQTDPAQVALMRDAIRETRDVTVELLNYRKDGRAFWNKMSITPVWNDSGHLTHYVGIQSDVSAQRNTEEQLRQAQKMEAIGQMAGGVAHDFNNVLTVIDGYTSLLADELSANEHSAGCLREIQAASAFASGLTRQLLAISRRQIRTPEAFDFHVEIAETTKLLERLISNNIALEVSLCPDANFVWADRGQVSQILMNLVINARDAMPGGGKLRVCTETHTLTEQKLYGGVQLNPGTYVVLIVSDTGCGMSSEVVAHIFEPFFTTKPKGKGTGLGLATVYGIVVQSNGSIEVLSEVGVGTTFRVLLPSVAPPENFSSRASASVQSLGGSETILLVEDNASLRRMTCEQLTSYGYAVLEAASGEEAIELFSEHPSLIQLVITDMVMPGMSGSELAEELVKLKANVRVLFISGHVGDNELTERLQQPAIHFLQKPFGMKELAIKVRDALQRNRQQST
jgi:PAS domain S-box-containing protein